MYCCLGRHCGHREPAPIKTPHLRHGRCILTRIWVVQYISVVDQQPTQGVRHPQAHRDDVLRTIYNVDLEAKNNMITTGYIDKELEGLGFKIHIH